MMILENAPDTMNAINNFGWLSDLGLSGGLVAVAGWFGKRFLALHDRLLERLDRVIEESLHAREAMDAARTSFDAMRGSPIK